MIDIGHYMLFKFFKQSIDQVSYLLQIDLCEVIQYIEDN
jgi:hypothetical protein